MNQTRRTTAQKAGSAPQTRSRKPSEEEIRRKAYERYVARGAAPGRDLEDWLEAERELFSKKRRS